jgi:hypothetical protein
MDRFREQNAVLREHVERRAQDGLQRARWVAFGFVMLFGVTVFSIGMIALERQARRDLTRRDQRREYVEALQGAQNSMVSGSVAARCSAIARLRRLARTGAACVTAPLISSQTAGLNAPCLSTSSEPMTSPPTSEGTQSELPSTRSHSSHVCSGALSGLRSWVRPRRIARHSRGVASTSASANPAMPVASVLASSELPLALRVNTTASAPGASRSARRRSNS